MQGQIACMTASHVKELIANLHSVNPRCRRGRDRRRFPGTFFLLGYGRRTSMTDVTRCVVTKHHGPRLTGFASASLQFGRVHPGFLGPFKSFGSRVPLRVAFVTGEFSCRKAISRPRSTLIGRDLRSCLCNNPITAATRCFATTDLHEPAPFHRQEMAWRENLHVNHRQNSMI